MNEKVKPGLKFKLATPKKKVSYKPKRISKLVHAICTQSEDGEFKANLRIVSNTKRVTNMCISFTLESYHLTNKERVFTIKPDKRGEHICYIRTPWEAYIAPKKSRLYTPFCKDWVYTGYIVRIGKGLYFDIKNAVWHKDFVTQDLDIPEDEIKL